MSSIEHGITAFIVLFICVLCFIFIKLFTRSSCSKKRRRNQIRRRVRNEFMRTNQQEDVYNISSRVQGQEQGQWPTHDNHVSLEHFTINETNKYNDDPPTYEEAMRIAAANNNNTAVAAVPKTTVTPTSTSTSTANQQ
nr:PREDICTED: uncharacterized protein LOC664363 isoform X3 [Tribolium castaneum]|eukprot:XP_008195916.1 PREDICTED: uncharacterized protein LOC664363 isoform X3 [Tribolium castaneum]